MAAVLSILCLGFLQTTRRWNMKPSDPLLSTNTHIGEDRIHLVIPLKQLIKWTSTNEVCWYWAAARYTLGAAACQYDWTGRQLYQSVFSARNSRRIVTTVIVWDADEMSESRQTHVTLHDIDSQALEQLVQYAYTAEIVVGEGNVQVSLMISDL